MDWNSAISFNASNDENSIYWFSGPIPASQYLSTESRNLIDTEIGEEKQHLKRVQEIFTSNVYSTPKFLNPYGSETIGTLFAYFDAGFAVYFLYVPVTYYLIYYLGISSTEYNTYLTLTTFPWCFQFLFGLLSDEITIYNYRRKSWLLIGWIFFVSVCLSVSAITRPSYLLITVMVVLIICAWRISNVCAGLLILERARYEHEKVRGSIQVSGFTAQVFGNVIGAIVGLVIFNTPQWGWGLTISEVFLLAALYPFVGVIPSYWWLVELAPALKMQPFLTRIADVWTTFQYRAIWQSLAFLLTYYFFQVPNAAWNNFLILGEIWSRRM